MMKIKGFKHCNRCGEYTRKHKHCQAVVESPTHTHEMCPNRAQFRIKSLGSRQSRRVCEAHIGYATSWLTIGPIRGQFIAKPATPIRRPPKPEPRGNDQQEA